MAIVSGLARGADSVAHQTALKYFTNYWHLDLAIVIIILKQP